MRKQRKLTYTDKITGKEVKKILPNFRIAMKHVEVHGMPGEGYSIESV